MSPLTGLADTWELRVSAKPSRTAVKSFSSTLVRFKKIKKSKKERKKKSSTWAVVPLSFSYFFKRMFVWTRGLNQSWIKT